VDVIREQHDTLFGGRMPAPSEKAQRLLSVYVTEHRCHLGIATDGDADRLGVVDENGNYLHANVLLVILYYYLVKYRGWKGPCVRNVSTTHLLDRVALEFGEKCYEVPVGFKHVSGKMAETDAIIGGESSGGMAIRGHIQGKDGIYAAALLVEMLAVTGKSVAEIYQEILRQYGKLYYEEQDYTTTAQNKLLLKQRVFEEKKLPEFPGEIAKISYADGCKVVFADGSWVIVRFSGTEPLLRLAAEGNTEAQARQLIECWRSFLRL
jgi:phosphomannomutase